MNTLFNFTDPGQAFVRPSNTNDPEQYALGKSTELRMLLIIFSHSLVSGVYGCALELYEKFTERMYKLMLQLF
jgi:hypothetical protein